MDVNLIKSHIYQYILDGNVSASVINELLNESGQFLAKETALWDYKKTYEDTPYSKIKLLKHIVSFHNTYGGYIIYGVQETEKDTLFIPVGVEKNIFNQQKLKGDFDRYFGKRIDLTYVNLSINVKGEAFNIGLLHIPKRAGGGSLSPIADTSAPEPNNSKKQITINKNFIYFRENDECRQAVSDDDFLFISSERDFNLSIGINKKQRKKVIEHNLPDKNYICTNFIGRSELIQELWAWLADEFQYIKVLAAEGGKGKTSIAYKFCQLLIKAGYTGIEQVIWLTAKKRQFKALSDNYLNMPEVHYNNLESLLREICLRTGTIIDEMKDYNVNQLKREAKNNLNVYPSFIVIDDVDSNDIDEQKKIMESARIISNQYSRILITTRVNNIYSSESSINVPGLEGQDYIDLVSMLCRNLNLPSYSEQTISNLNNASEGSPLFTESILRLCKRGMAVNDAIKDWNGKSGEAVREAALRKEVSELSQETIKVLVTISKFGACSRTELHQITDIELSYIDSAIDELGNLFLLQGITFIESEPRFETTSSISNLVLSICDEILPQSKIFVKRIEDVHAGLSINTKSNDKKVGGAITNCMAFIREERFSEARKTVNSLLKNPKYKENADLYFMLARIEYNDPTSPGDMIRKSFSEAYIKGQRKQDFFEMWYLSEEKYGTKDSIHEVCLYERKDNKEISSDEDQWWERYAHACFQKALSVNRFERKIELLVESYEATLKIIKKVFGLQGIGIKNLSTNIVDEIWMASLQSSNYLVAAKSIVNALKNGDVRSINCNRLIESSEKVRLMTPKDDGDYRKLNDTKDDIFQCLQLTIDKLKSQKNIRTELLKRLEEELFFYTRA